MFPIPWNKAYRKKDGSLVNIDDAMGGDYSLPTASSNTKGGIKVGSGLSINNEVLSADAQVPAHTSSEAGKVLTVANDGTLEWDVGGAGGGDCYTELILPAIEPRSSDYRIAIYQLPLRTTPNSTPSYSFTGTHTLDEVFLPEKYNCMEYYSYLKSGDITALNLTLLFEALLDAVTEVVLDEAITSFDAILIQGCYDTSGASNYDTTIVYSNPEINTPYWFGMKDRNTSYSGTVTFSDATHATLSASRRVKIFGFNL